MRFATAIPFAVGLALVAACGDDDRPATIPDASAGDAGHDAGVVPPERAVVPPEPPRIPWWSPDTGEVTLDVALPALTPCPAGWSEVTDGDATYCEPWPLGGGDCPAGQARFPGDPSCAPIGPACPAGRWPTDLPAGRTIVYVDASSPPGGTGTMAAPYDNLAEAVIARRLTPNVVFAVAPGVYEGGASLRTGNALIGACVEGVELRAGVLTGSEPVVYASGTAIELRNVRITSPVRKGIFTIGATLHIENVVIDGVTEGGIGTATTSRITARNLVVRNVAPIASGFGGGIVLRDGSSAELTRIILEDLPTTGVLAFDGGSYTLRDAVIRRVARNTSDGLGLGLGSIGRPMTAERVVVEDCGVIAVRAHVGATGQISDSLFRNNVATGDDRRHVEAIGASLELSRVATIGCGETCVLAHGAGSSVSIADLVAADAAGGLLSFAGGGITVTRLYATRAQTGVFAFQPGSSATVTDAWFRDVGGSDPASAFGLGRGIEANSDATIVAERVRCIDSITGCAGAAGPNASLTLTDAWSAGSRARLPYTNVGRDFAAEVGATLTARRALVERYQENAVLAGGGGHVDVEDLVARDSAADETIANPSGWGVALYQDATARLVRARIERVQEMGIAVSEGSTLDAEDVAIHDLRPEHGTDAKGIGVFVFGPGVVRATRLEIRGALDTGIYAFGRGDLTEIVANEVGIYDVEGEVRDGIFGRGVEALFGSRVTLSGAVVHGGRDVGIALFHPGTTATLDRVSVIDTRERLCAGTTCADNPSGSGLGVYEGAVATVNDFLIRGSQLCGVQIMTDASLDLSNGVVEQNTIGACVQVDGYDAARLMNGVVYRDNETTIDSTALPLPETHSEPMEPPPL